MAQIDLIRNTIGGIVNDLLANNEVSPTDMRYVLKAILGEVAEMELTQNYINQMREEQQKEKEENRE